MTSADERLALAASYLGEHGLDGLVAFNNGQNSFLESNAVFVLSGVRPMAESALILARDGASTLLVTPGWDAERAASLSCTARTTGTDELPAALAAALGRHRLDWRKLATVGLGTLGLRLARSLEAALGRAPQAHDGLTRDLARIRTEEELQSSRRASWIAERGYERMLEFARPGLREFELAAELYCHMKALGAEDNFLLVSASQHNLAVRAAGGRVLEAGDIILSEITPCYRGQYAQICRTTVLGEPGAICREKYPILREAMRRGQSAAIPGAAVGAVTAAMDACFREAGYGDFCRPPYMRVRGHGLGITSDRPGDLTTASDARLEAGMVFVMHPNQYLPETGYLMCGEPVVITQAGAVALTQRAATLDSVKG